jgi:molybdenum cofactor biosynthesis protein MoaC
MSVARRCVTLALSTLGHPGVALCSPLRCFAVGTHVDRVSAMPTMIDVGAKASSARTATAEASLMLPPCVTSLLRPQLPRRLFSSHSRRGQRRRQETSDEFPLRNLSSAKKGAVIHTAIIAGTQAAKLTSNLIPFCHPLPIERISFEFVVRRLLRSPPYAVTTTSPNSTRLEILTRCTVSVSGKTGVEMEALTGATVAALTLYDMLKGIPGAQSDGLAMAYVRVLSKRGGKSDFGPASAK